MLKTFSENIIIHIGYPKTGTTWFANNFYNRIKQVNFIPPERILNDILSSDYSKIRNQVASDKLNIIADPEFSGVIKFNWKNGSYRKEISEKLAHLFPNAKIILFIRNQIDFLTSAYVYYIRKGGTLSPIEILNSMLNHTFPVSLEYLEYDKIIRIYQNLFGEKNVYIFVYEDFFEDNTNFITKFITTFNLDIEPDAISFIPKNEKLRNHLLSFIKFSNKFTKMEVQNKNYIFHIPGLYKLINANYHFFNQFKIFGEKPFNEELFDAETTALINNYFRESNQILFREMNLKSMEQHKYPLSES